MVFSNLLVIRANNTSISNIIGILCLTLFLSACVKPTYKFQQQEQSAKLRYLTAQPLVMCRDGRLYDLKKYSEAKAGKKLKYTLLPVGKRIILQQHLNFPKYNPIYNCKPTISFIPKAEKTYIVNAGVIGRFCFIEVVREDNLSITGISAEPTASNHPSNHLSCHVKK